jgi:hypothetical protein
MLSEGKKIYSGTIFKIAPAEEGLMILMKSGKKIPRYSSIL